MSEHQVYDWFDQDKAMEVLAQRQREIHKKSQSQHGQSATERHGEPAVKKNEAEPKQTAAPLRPSTQVWFDQLPSEVKPTAMRYGYPHILDALSRAWEIPRHVNQVLEELLIDTRGGRDGFPLQIIREILSLREFYFKHLNPKASVPKQKAEPNAGMGDWSRK